MEYIKKNLAEIKTLLLDFESQISEFNKIATEVIEVLKRKNKILICGNGGSAAESQHMAAELVGRFQKERKAIPAISLTTDTSILTSVSNDYSFEDVFARQIEAIGVEGDILFGFSTSGNSKNIIKAFEKAKLLKIKTVAVCGSGGKMAELADYVFKVNSSVTARVQEIHLIFIHMLCQAIENELSQ